MVTPGLLVLCAATFLLAEPKPVPVPTEDRDKAVAATLAVQTALEQGRDLVLRGEYRAAIYILEGQLTHINGNRVYLRALQEAYRGHIKALRLAKQEAAAETYAQRLSILDPGFRIESATRTAAIAAAPVPMPPENQPRPLAESATRAKATIRMQDADPPARAVPPPVKETPARQLLARAEAQFGQRHYREAEQLYQQADKLDRELVAPSRPRWAYCKLYVVVEQINQPGRETPPWTALEREAQLALELAPQLDFGKKVLAEIQQRKPAGATPNRQPDVPLQHHGRGTNGWSISESPNFRIVHNQCPEYVAQVAQVAERTRTEAWGRWFGTAERNWVPKCDIILHATAQDYQKATGMPTQSPGHSKLEMDGPRLLGRQVHLRCDHPNVVTAILPHETTHVVLAGGFTDVGIPRWADEGIAVLTEPREQIEQHLRNLSKHHQDGTLFSVRELMEQSYQPQQEKYPEARRIGAFYAQSISLVEYLTNLGGPRQFMAFLQAGLRQGYEPALQRYYSIRDFQDLQQRWQKHAFREVATR